MTTVESPATPQTKNFAAHLDALMAFQAPYLEERVLKLGLAKDKFEYHYLFDELKKFLWLSQTFKPTLSLFSLRVDEIWHQFILFTKQYQEFCQSFFGAYVHHLPESSHIPREQTPREEFEQLYGSQFGTIPPIWRENAFTTCGPTGGCSRGG